MRKAIWGILLAFVLIMLTAGPAMAASSELDWTLFKIYNSPAWVWGEDGAIITPTPNVATNGVYYSGNIINIGTYNNEPACFATDTLTLSTGNLEIGITHKYVLLDWQRLDVDSTIAHIKFQPFVTKFINIAAGAVAVQVSPNPFTGTFEENFFTNAFVVVGLQLGPIYLNGGAELGLLGSEKTEPFYFVNGKIKLGHLLLIGEAIATDEHGEGGIYNIGLATDYKNINFGLGVLDAENADTNLQIIAFASIKY